MFKDSSIALYLLLLPLMCIETAQAQEHSFQVFQENGITIAETTGEPKYSQDIFRYEHILTLQEDESRPESLLGNPITANMVEYDGWFYVLDHSPMRIACFDSDGNYSHDIGRAGQGPGEFLYPRMQSVTDGIVTVYDRSLLRLSLFHTDGTFIESRPVKAVGGYQPDGLISAFITNSRINGKMDIESVGTLCAVIEKW
jgi:hypothetical protein